MNGSVCLTVEYCILFFQGNSLDYVKTQNLIINPCLGYIIYNLIQFHVPCIWFVEFVFTHSTYLITISWWVLSASPLGLADVMANGPVNSHRWAVAVWSGTLIIMLSLVPTRSYAGPTPANNMTSENDWREFIIITDSWKCSLSKVLIWLVDHPKFDPRVWVGFKYKMLMCVYNLTEFKEPFALWDNATNASWVDISHELPQQRTEGRFGCHKLLNTWDTDTNRLFRRTVLPERKVYGLVGQLTKSKGSWSFVKEYYMYFDRVDLLNCTGVLAWSSQGIDSICRDATHSIVFQQFCNLEQSAGFPRLSNKTWICGLRFLLFLVLWKKQIR